MGRHLPKWASVRAYSSPAVPLVLPLDPRAVEAAGCPLGPDNAGTVLQSHLIFVSCHISWVLSLGKALLPGEDLSLASIVPLLGNKWVQLLTPSWSQQLTEGSEEGLPARRLTAPSSVYNFICRMIKGQPETKKRPRKRLLKADTSSMGLGTVSQKAELPGPCSPFPPCSFLPLVL